MAEGLGFEPRVPFGYNGFQDRRLQPLGHPSGRGFPRNSASAAGRNGLGTACCARDCAHPSAQASAPPLADPRRSRYCIVRRCGSCGATGPRPDGATDDLWQNPVSVVVGGMGAHHPTLPAAAGLVARRAHGQTARLMISGRTRYPWSLGAWVLITLLCQPLPQLDNTLPCCSIRVSCCSIRILVAVSGPESVAPLEPE